MGSAATPRPRAIAAARTPWGATCGAVLALASLTACFSISIGGSALTERREIPVRVQIRSEPPGARVTDIVTGEDLGTTPLDFEAFVLRFEAYELLNQSAERERLMELPADSGEAAYVVSSERGSPRLMESASSPLVLRYRLEKEGYLPLDLTREVRPAELPHLEKEPRILLDGRLAPAP